MQPEAGLDDDSEKLTQENIVVGLRLELIHPSGNVTCRVTEVNNDGFTVQMDESKGSYTCAWNLLPNHIRKIQ